MTYSMTAFARVQSPVGNSAELCWEIRTVNHRYLDVSFRLPEELRFLETSLRAKLRNYLSRGKVECQLKCIESAACGKTIVINEALVDGLLDSAHQLAAKKHLANDLSISQVLAWPGVIQDHRLDSGLLCQQAEAVFEDALIQLINAREKEGQALKQCILQRLDHLENELTKARMEASSLAPQSKEKLSVRLQALETELSDARFEQEIALILARLDVSEELDRLFTHLMEVKRVLENEKLAGRRLDFLMQELHREANTLSAKSDSIFLTQCTVEMKVLIEQMREQVQNIE